MRSGAFHDVDVTLHWHPGDGNSVSQGRSLANVSAKFRFHGQSAHAALAPDKGRAALDGIESRNYMMREHVPQETRIDYVIIDGGKSPNVVPDFAESYLYVRHPDPAVVKDVFGRIEEAAEGAALGTGTDYDVEITGGVYSVLPNDTLGQMMDRNLRAAERIEWTGKEQDFASELQKSLGDAPPALSTVADVHPTVSVTRGITRPMSAMSAG